MYLSQVFKTLEGAQKRAKFETAHSKTHLYTVTRCIAGEPDTTPFDTALFSKYEWRIKRTRR